MNKIITIIGLCMLLFVAGCSTSMPECYLTSQKTCIDGYYQLGWSGAYWSMLPLIQCCKEPPYVIQGIEPTLYTMKIFCEKVNETEYADE